MLTHQSSILMDGWMVSLEAELLRQNELLSNCTARLRKFLGSQVKRKQCGKCDTMTWVGALVTFPCEMKRGNDTYEVDHPLCFDCLEDKLERHRGFLDKQRMKGGSARLLYDRCLECVITCEECHTPAVISRKIAYEGGIENDDAEDGHGHGGGARRRIRYCIEDGLTTLLRDKFSKHSFYENQRRTPFSKFHKDHLFAIERPHVSDEDGAAVTGDDTPLEPGFVWLEDWRVVANIEADTVKLKVPVGSSSAVSGGASAAGGGASSGPDGAAGGGGGGAASTVGSAVTMQTRLTAPTSSLPGADSQYTTESSFVGGSMRISQGASGAAGGGASADPTVEAEIAQTVTDPSGWQYSFIWPKSMRGDGFFIWHPRPTANTFVRRRKKTRAYLALTPELRDALQTFMHQENAARMEKY